MTGKRIKKALKCKVCQKILGLQNKSHLCSHHYKMKYWNNKRKERKAKHLCITCGKKVEPKIVFPAGDKIKSIITYPVRCYACRENYKKHYQKYLNKQKTASVTTAK